MQPRINSRISQWFSSLNIRDPATDIDHVALLSALFPKRRTDRVYSLKADSLSKKLKRVLCLGRGRWELLDNWKKPGRGDLGECVLRALRGAENPLTCAARQVTVEEIDRVLAGIAKGNRFSAPTVRNGKVEGLDPNAGLELIYRRLQSREAKWFTRMILKDYSPLVISENLVYRCIDPQLPIAMKIYDNFDDAMILLSSSGIVTSESALKPQIGIKVGRPSYRPARGIKHAVQTIRGRKMSVEKKYDGEYCQIHVDLRNATSPFQLFSKSGKDSTVDRAGLHQVLVDCLRIGNEDSAIAQKCILEGEMVVWSDRANRVLDFCKIRKLVSRTGSFLGTLADSQPHPWEHLMIVFYDVLLLDDHSLLSVPHASRRKLLEQLILPVPGRADLVAQREIDFSRPRAPIDLQDHFAQAIANRWEGLVLKPSDEPYFGPARRIPDTYPSCWLKMKKDYIAGLGDTADFAVVGAGYDVQEATRRGDKRLNWTHFHIGCLKNKSEVLQLHAKPEYVVLDAVTQSISSKDLTWLNQHGQFRSLDVGSLECSRSFEFEITPALAAKMTVAFKEPFVFEVMGGGFEKPPNSENLRLRWPRVLKIHQDRDWKNAITMDELQMKAAEAIAVPLEKDFLGEVEIWQTRLDAANRGTRKTMLPWDDSQYEESDDEEQRSQTRDAPRPSIHARSKRAVAAPFIRMDTVEMAPEEQRMPNGQVRCRPASQGSTSSAASRSSLPTPPTSSPDGKDWAKRTASPTPPLQTPATVRKRKTREASGTDNAPTKRRKQKDSSLGKSKDTADDRRKRKYSEVVIIDDDPPIAKRQRPVRDRQPEPLQEITNASNQIRPSAPTKPTSIEPKKTSHAEPFLVRKIPAVTDARFLPKSRRQPWRAIVDPSSTPRGTTASECSTQTSHDSSQHSISRSNLRAKLRYNHQHTTMSTTLRRSASVPLEVPDLLQRRVMLSPCVYNNSRIMERYFPGRLNNIIPLPTVATSISHFPPTPPPSKPSTNEEVILLTDIVNERKTGQFLSSLVPCLPTCGYNIAIWNWRILKFPLDNPPPPDSQAVRELYLATMSYSLNTHEVITVWQDGKETRVRPDTLENTNPLDDSALLNPHEAQGALPQTDPSETPSQDGHASRSRTESLETKTLSEGPIRPTIREAKQTQPHSKPLQLPNTLLHPVMLTPCVSQNPLILENYLQGRLHDVIPHPSNNNPSSSPPTPSSSKSHTILLLIDAKNFSPTGKSMEAVVRWLPGSGYKEVELWHWKVLKLAKEGGYDERRVEKCFYAVMRLRSGDRERREEVEVVTEWRNGMVTRVRVGRDGSVELVGGRGGEGM